jgi:hypothetical protein
MYSSPMFVLKSGLKNRHNIYIISKMKKKAIVFEKFGLQNRENSLIFWENPRKIRKTSLLIHKSVLYFIPYAETKSNCNVFIQERNLS